MAKNQELYLVIWYGGNEPAAYYGTRVRKLANNIYGEWMKQLEDTDIIEMLDLSDLDDITVVRQNHGP